MKCVSSYPKISAALVLLLIVVELGVADGRKIPDKPRKHSSKETRCPEGKDGVPCIKSARQGDIAVNSTNSDVAVSPTHNQYIQQKATFVKRFEHAMNFAERIVVDFARRLFPAFYGWEENGWEIQAVELVVRTVAKDMLMIMRAM